MHIVCNGTVLHRALAAVNTGRATKTGREPLQGVHLRCRMPDGTVELTTTEARILHRLTLSGPLAPVEDGQPESVLLDGDWLAGWLKQKPSAGATVELTVSDGVAQLACLGNITRHTVGDVENYPQTDGLLTQPDRLGVSGPACLSPRLLSLMLSAHTKWANGVDGATVLDTRHHKDNPSNASASRMVTVTADGRLESIIMGIHRR